VSARWAFRQSLKSGGVSRSHFTSAASCGKRWKVLLTSTAFNCFA
jgi:hypothetical protein